jgi:hypothetical protein
MLLFFLFEKCRLLKQNELEDFFSLQEKTVFFTGKMEFKFPFRTLDESSKSFFYQTVGYQTKPLNKL